MLKLNMDRRRWLQWLYEAKKRYDLSILNYTVTSNHVHLLVADDKGRKGAFWEDRYHATAIQSEQYLLRCIVYIDLNMVRAGVVSHPSKWQFGGYNEIQKPRRKCALIAYEKLATLSSYSDYNNFQEAHSNLVEESLCNKTSRQSWWSESIAVGSELFVDTIKRRLGLRAKGRKVLGIGEGYQLREDIETYITDLGSEK